MTCLVAWLALVVKGGWCLNLLCILVGVKGLIFLFDGFGCVVVLLNLVCWVSCNHGLPWWVNIWLIGGYMLLGIALYWYLVCAAFKVVLSGWGWCYVCACFLFCVT